MPGTLGDIPHHLHTVYCQRNICFSKTIFAQWPGLLLQKGVQQRFGAAEPLPARTSHPRRSPPRGRLLRGLGRWATHSWLLHLTSASLLLADLAASTCKKLPRYPTVPAIRMGRLAVDQAFKGQGLGGALLADARAARSGIAAFALMVDAKNEAAAAFYRHHGIIALPDSSLSLFLPLATIQRS